MRAARAAGLAIAALLLAGCAGPGTYLRSRGADLLDAIPVSIAHGWGLGISAKATPLFQVGLAISPIVSRRVGYEDRLYYGVWSEYQASFPWSLWIGDLGLVPRTPEELGFVAGGGLPLLYRWESFRDAPSGEGVRTDDYFEPNPQSWGRHPPVTRETCGALLIPAMRRRLDYIDLRRGQGDPDVLDSLGTPERATLWETRREGRPVAREWDLFELDVMFVFLGARVGFRPVEAADFLVGLVGLDLLGDDLPAPESWEPAPPS